MTRHYVKTHGTNDNIIRIQQEDIVKSQPIELSSNITYTFFIRIQNIFIFSFKKNEYSHSKYCTSCTFRFLQYWNLLAKQNMATGQLSKAKEERETCSPKPRDKAISVTHS